MPKTPNEIGLFIGGEELRPQAELGSETEAVYRKAGRLINQKHTSYRDMHQNISDKKALAMVCLELASTLISREKDLEELKDIIK